MFRRRHSKTLTGDHAKPSFVLAAHVLGGHRSEFENFEDYLDQNGYEVRSVAFPLSSEQETTVVRTRAHGNLLESETRHRSRNVFFRSFTQILSPNARVSGDVWIGFNSVALLTGGIFKRRRLRVLWSIDYVPKRDLKIETVAYRIIEKISIWRADVLIDNNEFAAQQRIGKRNGMTLFERPTLISPISVDLSVFKPENKEISEVTIGFLGALNTRTGADRLIPVFELIALRFPEVKLEVIGDGPLLPQLQEAAAHSNFSESISIIGFLEGDLAVADHVNKWSLGLAPFLDDESSWTKFADPQKLKIYLASGVIPVVSEVPLIVGELREKSLALVLGRDAGNDQYANEVISVLSDSEQLGTMRQSISSYRMRFDRDELYERVAKFIASNMDL